MKKITPFSQRTHEQYYKFSVPAKAQQRNFGSKISPPTSPLKSKRNHLSLQNQFFYSGSASKGKRQGYSKPKACIKKLSSKMFKEAHNVKGETFLTKPQFSAAGYIKSESESKHSKKSNGDPNNGKLTNSESKLQIKKVVQIRVQGQQGDLTREIAMFGQVQQKLKKGISKIQTIPEISGEIQRLTSKNEDCNQTLLDLMKVI